LELRTAAAELGASSMTSDLRLVLREYRGEASDVAPSTLPLNELHVWHWELTCPPQETEKLWNILADDERQRAQRFHFAKLRDAFVINRGRLRSLLAGYLSKAPEQLVFAYTLHGKPSLPDGAELRFNLSHTEGRAALAVVQGREIGIDVEQIRTQADARKIAERFFSERERLALREFSGEALDRAFFRCWTRKEAYIKAKGEGLSIPLHQFDVSLGEDEPAVVLGTRPDSEECKRWQLYELALSSGCAAALAVAAPE
jgi:4'-phosphopantetheinyl transferase